MLHNFIYLVQSLLRKIQNLYESFKSKDMVQNSGRVSQKLISTLGPMWSSRDAPLESYGISLSKCPNS